MLVGVGNSPADPAQPQGCGRLEHHNSICAMAIQLNLLINLPSMSQSRADITLGGLGRGIQIGINNGPIHLPPGTSAKAQA
jgi:hypothetical protein